MCNLPCLFDFENLLNLVNILNSIKTFNLFVYVHDFLKWKLYKLSH